MAATRQFSRKRESKSVLTFPKIIVRLHIHFLLKIFDIFAKFILLFTELRLTCVLSNVWSEKLTLTLRSDKN